LCSHLPATSSGFSIPFNYRLDREIQNVRGRGYGFRENSCCFRDESELGSENSSRSLVEPCQHLLSGSFKA